MKNPIPSLLLCLSLLGGGSAAQAHDRGMNAETGPALQQQAQAALERLFVAIRSGDPQKVAPLLDPVFQVQRADGAVYDRESYLARSIPVVRVTPRFENLRVTRQGPIVVTTMRLQIDETIDGKQAQSNAPQLVVFRIRGGVWRVIAAANFAQLR